MSIESKSQRTNPAGLPRELKRAYERLTDVIARHESMVIAYSGGVDSGLLAYVGHRVLGNRALCVIGASPSLPKREEEAKSTCRDECTCECLS